MRKRQNSPKGDELLRKLERQVFQETPNMELMERYIEEMARRRYMGSSEERLAAARLSAVASCQGKAHYFPLIEALAVQDFLIDYEEIAAGVNGGLERDKFEKIMRHSGFSLPLAEYTPYPPGLEGILSTFSTMDTGWVFLTYEAEEDNPSKFLGVLLDKVGPTVLVTQDFDRFRLLNILGDFAFKSFGFDKKYKEKKQVTKVIFAQKDVKEWTKLGYHIASNTNTATDFELDTRSGFEQTFCIELAMERRGWL